MIQHGDRLKGASYFFLAITLLPSTANASTKIEQGMARIDAWTVNATVELEVRLICGLGRGNEGWITDRRWKAVYALYDGHPPGDKLVGGYLRREIERRTSAIVGGPSMRNCRSIRMREWSM